MSEKDNSIIKVRLPKTDYPPMGKIALDKGIISEKQLQEAWAIKHKLLKEHNKKLSIADILFKKRIISEDTMNRLKIATARQLDKEFGIIAARDYSISEEDIDKALIKQAEIYKKSQECVLIGDILIYKKQLTREQTNKILSEQNRSEEMLPGKITTAPKAASEPGKVAEEPKSDYPPNLSDEKPVEEQKTTKPGKIEPLTENTPGPSIEGIKDKRFFQIRELDKKFAKIVISKNLATKDEVDLALTEQLNAYKDSDHKKFLGKILVEKGVLTNKQFTTIMLDQQRYDFFDKKFGDIAIEKGFVRKSDIKKALEEQKNILIKTGQKKQIGEILVSLESMSEEQLKEVMAEQTGEDHAEKNDEGDIQQVKIKNCDFEFIVSKDGLSAFIKRDDIIPETISASDIKIFLKEKKIVYGIIDDSLVEGFLKHGAHKGKKFRVAEGKPAKSGRDGKIKYHFDTEHLKAGSLDQDGNIDYKDRGEIPHVPAGELLAERISSINGEKGIDVYGRPVEPPAVKDAKLKCGPGTQVSDDNLKLYAKIEGQPSLVFGGKVSVLSNLEIKGDIGLKTGHVEFDGNVKVMGAVQSGFKVNAGSITAKEIYKAEVVATEDVIISGGINGATIYAGGNVSAKYITKTIIFSFGDVIAQKEILDSKIETSGAVLVKNGKIISSEVASKKGIESMDIGTDMSSPCKLKVGVDTHGEREIQIKELAIQTIKTERMAIVEKMEAFEKEDQTINLKIAEQAQIQDRSMIEQRSLKEQMDALTKEGKKEEIAKIAQSYKDLEKKASNAESCINDLFTQQDKMSDEKAGFSEKIKQFDDRIDELRDEKEDIQKWVIKDKAIPVVKARGAIYEGSHISGPNASITLEKTYKNIHIKELKAKDPNSGGDWEMKVIIQKS
jgi:uncharacterized protein